MAGKSKRYLQGQIRVSDLPHPEKYKGNNRVINFKSSLEYHYIKFLDRNENVYWWNYEETVIPYTNPVDKRPHRYFPDFRLSYLSVTGRVTEAIVEIKPAYQTTEVPALTKTSRAKTSGKNEAEIMEHVINTAKWQACFKYCQKQGIKFVCIDEFDIMYGPNAAKKRKVVPAFEARANPEGATRNVN